MEQNADKQSDLPENVPNQQSTDGEARGEWFRRFRKGITTSTAEKICIASFNASSQNLILSTGNFFTFHTNKCGFDKSF